jgi:hypothetical protein
MVEKLDNIEPRALNLPKAASYWGVAPGSFKKLVRLGVAPAPIRIPGFDRVIWDKRVLDEALDRLRDSAAA